MAEEIKLGFYFSFETFVIERTRHHTICSFVPLLCHGANSRELSTPTIVKRLGLIMMNISNGFLPGASEVYDLHSLKLRVEVCFNLIGYSH